MTDVREYEFIKLRIEEGVAFITLDRPRSRNALSGALLDELDVVIASTEGLGVRSVILTGGAACFSSGADLAEAVETVGAEQLLLFNRRWRRLTYTIEHLMLPVIAAIEGYCLTGGLELALACDFRIAGTGSQFGITSSRIGSVAGAGGTQRLPRQIGPSAAKRLLMTAEVIDATEAHRIGLIDEVTPEGGAEARSLEFAKTIAVHAPLSIGWHKLAVNVGMSMDLESALDFEAMISGRAFTTADKREGMSAFLEKRSAVFEGK